ncbi:NAD(P)-dependent oxidoreductase [Variovorax sp. PCZ-1]|nr:NAD(P)-dependent oxidoreductase [Variovorax sp. PCZ-1]
MEKTVSIIGAGNMGGGMALNLLARGYAVHVGDIDITKEQFLEQKGAIADILPAQSAIKSIVTIICVVDGAQVQDVLLGHDGLLKAPADDLQKHTVMLCPTISPQDVEHFADLLASHGVRMIEAPMSGGPKRAQDGSMSLMVACEDALFKQHQALLRDLSSKLFHVSQRIGDGARTKLVNNLLAAINLTSAAEAIAMAQKLGLDAKRTLDVIEQSSGQSWIGSERMRRALTGNVHPPGAHITLLAKDTQLAMQTARDAGCVNPVGEAATGLFAQALERGMGDLDDAQMLRLLQG